MTLTRKALCTIYALIALLALISTWGHNVVYLPLGFVGANLKFWQETLVNPASRSITLDIFYFGIAVFVWMALEARRLQMRGFWLYVVLSMLVAISVTVPVFLIQRERKLAQLEPANQNTMASGNAALIAAFALAVTALSVQALRMTHAP